jgi:hypothetical protein
MVLPTARIEGALLPQCAQSRQSELLARYGRVPSLVSLDRGVDISRDLSMHREEFIVVGSTDPEGSRPHLGALLLAYYAPDGRLVYAGRAGTGMPVRELARLAARLKPLATDRMRSTCRRRGRAASAHGSCSHACTGCGRSSWPKSPTSNGLTTGCCGRSHLLHQRQSERRRPQVILAPGAHVYR